MNVDYQGVSLTEDHSLESASEVMSALKLEQWLPNGRDDYMELLRDLGFESNPDGSEQHNQFAFQGQCLILGDDGVGKTSLTKSLMGKPFDTEEPGTKDVEINLVDREWNDLGGYSGLAFGTFRRFESSVEERALCCGPGGMRVIFKHEAISNIMSFSQLFFILLRVCWVISVVWLWAFNATVPHLFFLFSLAAVIAPFLLEQLNLNIPNRPKHFNLYKLRMLIYTTPCFFTGLGTVHILTKNCKSPFACVMEMMFPNLNTCRLYREFACLYIWRNHFFIFTVLVAEISVNLIDLMWRYCCNWQQLIKERRHEESPPLLPGQGKIEITSTPIWLRILLCFIPVVGGIICAFVVELSTKKSIFEQGIEEFSFPVAIIFPFTFASFFVLDLRIRGEIKCGIYVLLLSLLYFEMLNWIVFSLLWFYDLYKFWETFSPVVINEPRIGFIFIVIKRVLLNFPKLKSALDKAFSSLKLKLLDISGERGYCAYHHIFMRHGAMYVVVFNMTHFVDENFGNITEKMQRIRYWLESICSNTNPKTQIILVGTHRGRVDQYCLKTIDTHLREYLWHDFSDELVLNKEEELVYFGIENSLGRDDNGIRNLQREIMLAAEKQKATMGRKIPYSWIKIQDAIINLRQSKKAKFCVTKNMFPVSVGNFICSNWSLDTLRYFHAKGLIICIGQKENSKLSDWILLKPELLVDIVKALVTPLTTQQDGLRRDRTLLHEKGMLTNCLLEKTISRFNEDGIALKSFLEEYDIICPLFYNYKSMKEEAQVTHFVPSLLPISSDKDPQVWLDGPDDKKFYVFFHRFLPEPLFHKLLSRAHMLSKAQFPKGRSLICSNVGRFWLQPNQPYRLLLLKNEEMIEVTCNSRYYQRVHYFSHDVSLVSPIWLWEYIFYIFVNLYLNTKNVVGLASIVL